MFSISIGRGVTSFLRDPATRIRPDVGPEETERMP